MWYKTKTTSISCSLQGIGTISKIEYEMIWVNRKLLN
jgi:hypothetical protein